MSSISSRASSPDVDFSVIRTAIEIGGKVIEQIFNGIHYGSEEVRNLLLEESDFIMECKVCRNLFRSLPNYVAHKRVYCKEGYKEHLEKQNEMPKSISEEIVVVHPELPETTAGINEAVEPKSGTQISVVDEVVKRTFVGKSQDYQFYTKVAEAAEKKKAGKVTNTVTLEPITSNRNAVTMTVSKEHNTQNKESPTSILKQILLTDRNTAETNSKSKTKPSLLKVVENLASKKVCNKTLDDNLQCRDSQNVKARSVRSRKSSPRKSVDSYIGMKEQPEPETRGNNPTEDDSDNDLEEWFKDPSATRGNISSINDYVHEREWLEHCDIEKSYCKTCDKKFTSVYALKFHVKVKHTGKEGQYMCPKCGKTFVYFMALARHLRGAHRKSEPYIGKLQLMLRGALGRRKSLERGVEDNSKQSVHADGDLVQDPKIATNLLPYATGWKKCDKCGKVCWKAKSYNRHYQTCRGSEKEKESGVESMNASKTHKRNENNSSVKEVENTRVESLASKDMPYGTRLSKASQNKGIGTKDKCSSLIAETITESACSVEVKKQKEVSSQTQNTNVISATRVMDAETNSSPLNMKPQQKSVTEAVEKTIISTRSHGSVEIPNVVDVVQGLKSLEHNIEGTRLSKASQNKGIGTKDKCSSLIAEQITESACNVEIKKQKEVSSQKQNTNVISATRVMDAETNSSPLNMKPQQKSVTETVEKTIISTRSHGSVEIPNVVDVVQGLKSLEHNIEACSEKGIKELKKLKIDMVEYDVKSRESAENIHMTKVSPRKVTVVKGSLTKCSPSSDIRTVYAKEHAPIKAKEAEKEAPKIPDIKLNSPKKVLHRSSDNLSLESQVDQSLNMSRDSSPVRMSNNSLSVPIGSPTDTPVISPTLYSIGSPSRHSESSYDGSTYGGKIPLRRMSVKEMAEIVESASLVKFARERGNKARRVLNKQQKISTNSIPKQRIQIVRKTDPTVERKVYGTRHLSKKEKDAHVKGNDTSTYETRSANHSVSDNEISNENVLTSISSSDSITISLVEPSAPKQSNDIGVVDSSLKTGRIQLRQRKSFQNRMDDSDSNIKEKQEKPIISPAINIEDLIPHGTSLLEHSNNTPSTQLADVALVSSIETRQLRARKSLNDTVVDSKNKHVERKRHQSESDTCRSGNTISSDNAPNKGVKRPSKSSERANHGSSAEKMLTTPESKHSQNLYMEIDSIRKLRSTEKSSIVDKTETGSSKHAQVSKNISISPHRKTKCNKIPVKQLLDESILDKSEKASDETENNKELSRDSSAKVHVPGSSACKGSDISIIDSSDQTNTTGTRSRTRNTSRLSAPSLPDNHPVEVLHEDNDKDKTDESALSENDAPRLASLMKDISDIQEARHGNETSKRSETKLNSDRKTMLAAERMLRGQKDKNRSNIFELLTPGSEKIKEENYNKQETHNANDSFNPERANNTGNDKSYSDRVGTNEKIQSRIDSVPLSPVNSQHSDASTTECHPHRTRLSTGTIAPLDLSYLDEDPTEPDRSDFALKYFTSTKALLPNTSAKGQLPAKSINSSNGMSTKVGQPSMNAPKRFSLQTGVIQCEKCHKTFWKKQSYQIHMRSSQCRDPDMVVVKGKHRQHMKSNKRALSISPNKSGSIDNVITSSGPSHSDKLPSVKRYKQDVSDRNKVDNSSSEIEYHSGLAESVTSVINIGTDTHSGSLKTSKSSSVDKISLPQQISMGSYGMQTEIAGPSHINLCEDSDDGSEFSGFSEADIYNSSLELIALNFDGDNDDSDDSSLADVSSMGADESSKESTKCLDKVFPNMEISATVGEKVKSNRKYVMDSQKSSKLRCQDQVRVDHLIDVKNKKCIECGLKFSSNSNARRHAIRHLGWKRYRCNICQFSCYNLSECRIHLTKTHSVPQLKCDKESFSSFITDLNKEASKRRTVKRMKTIQKKKANESGSAITNLRKSSGTGYLSSKQLEHKSSKEILGIQTMISMSENKMDEMSSVAIGAELDKLHNRKHLKSPDESLTECSVNLGKSVDSPVKKSLRLAAKGDVRPSALEMLKGNSTLKVSPAINVNKANKVEIKTTHVAEKGNADTRFHESPAQTKYQTKDPPTKVNLGDSPLEIARLKLAKALDY